MKASSPDSFLIGYPRSGTNFLQSVVEASSNRQARSLYQSKLSLNPAPISLKSHAFSLKTLLHEIHVLTKQDISPEKIIIIFRDPRDVIISYFEFTETILKLSLKQDSFLQKMFFDPFNITARNAQTEDYLDTLTVEEAYKLHAKNWFEFEDDKINSLVVHFEKLKVKPTKEFRKILDFLDITGPIAEDKFDLKVSQYSENDRPRGIARGWKQNIHRYRVLINQVEKQLSQEIDMLGYND
nr:sulfotransferase domain-containing protein [uncultured Desulfobulbus sp.]